MLSITNFDLYIRSFKFLTHCYLSGAFFVAAENPQNIYCVAKCPQLGHTHVRIMIYSRSKGQFSGFLNCPGLIKSIATNGTKIFILHYSARPNGEMWNDADGNVEYQSIEHFSMCNFSIKQTERYQELQDAMIWKLAAFDDADNHFTTVVNLTPKGYELYFTVLLMQ